MKVLKKLIFEGLLQLIFSQLYPFAITPQTWNCMFVNKRWSRAWQHPLMVFYSGQFNRLVSEFPPSYYAQFERDFYHKRRVFWRRLSKSIGKT